MRTNQRSPGAACGCNESGQGWLWQRETSKQQGRFWSGVRGGEEGEPNGLRSNRGAEEPLGGTGGAGKVAVALETWVQHAPLGRVCREAEELYVSELAGLGLYLLGTTLIITIELSS